MFLFKIKFQIQKGEAISFCSDKSIFVSSEYSLKYLAKPFWFNTNVWKQFNVTVRKYWKIEYVVFFKR